MSYSDNPIKKIKEDRLGRTAAVDALQGVLAELRIEDTPLAVGIYGDWGSGKTSVMNLLMDRLSGEDLKLWFDAWKYGHRPEALWRALLLTVVEGIRQANPEAVDEAELDAIATSLYRSQETIEKGDLKWNLQAIAPLAVRSVLRLIPGLGEEVGKTLDEFLAKGDDVKEVMRLVERESVTHIREQISSIEQFQKQLGDLIDTHVVGPKHRLYLFIDDLDRCLPEAAVSTLEAIKLFLDFRGCVFIIGMDPAVVEQGIAVRYKELAASGTQKGIDPKQYLDKIIQLPFTLPPLSEGQMSGFITQWGQDAEQPDIAACADVIVTGVQRNPRSVKRTLNVLRLAMALRNSFGAGTSGDDLKLLAKFIVLQTSYDDDYRKVAANLQHIRDLETKAKDEKAGTGGHDESQQRQMEMLRMAPTFDERTDEEIAGLLYVARATSR